jgi:hypothetical protein
VYLHNCPLTWRVWTWRKSPIVGTYAYVHYIWNAGHDMAFLSATNMKVGHLELPHLVLLCPWQYTHTSLIVLDAEGASHLSLWSMNSFINMQSNRWSSSAMSSVLCSLCLRKQVCFRAQSPVHWWLHLVDANVSDGLDEIHYGLDDWWSAVDTQTM